MGTVKDYLEQYECFKNGKKQLPLLTGRYFLESDKLSELPEGFGLPGFKPAKEILGINTLFYFESDDEKLIRVLISNAGEESSCEVEILDKFKVKEIFKMNSLYVYDKEKTKALNAMQIQKLLVRHGDYCDENMKPLYMFADLEKEAFWDKYAE